MQVLEQQHVSGLSTRSRLDAVVAKPYALLTAIFLVFIIVFAASIFLVPRRYGRLIVGDGIYYYVYLRSAVLDGDLDFTNDYTLYQQFNNEDPVKKREMLEDHKTPFGQPANYFSVGPAVLWAPAFIITHAFARLSGLPSDGFSYLYEAPLLFLSILYGFIGVLLIYRVAADLFSRFAALVAILGIWLATNVVYYMGVSPSASHVLSLFAAALFVFLWWRGRNGRTRLDWFIWGLSAGLMTLVRWQDVLIALLALFEWLANSVQRSAVSGQPSLGRRIRSALPDGLLFALGLILAFIPQMLAWQILYGAPLTAPQGTGFFQLTRPEMLNVWFSFKRGLFTWTPLILLAVIGFIPLYRKNRILGASAIAIFIAETYVNSIVNDWWGGEAFGARRFISLMPFFALGLAALVDALQARVSKTVIVAALGALMVWNLLFIFQYDLWLHGIGQISAQPTVAEITVGKFTAPFELLKRLQK